MKKRVFTNEELREMGERTIDLLNQAIDAGDKEKAKNMAKRMFDECFILHDLYLDWTSILMSYIYNNNGEDALYQAMRDVFGVTAPPAPEKTDFRTKVQMAAMGLRGHLVPLKVKEDDEKVCLTMKPCGSGEKLVKTGRYKPPFNCTMIQKPHNMTWGMTDFPVYCVHAPVGEILAMESSGYPVSPAFPAKKVGRGACTHCVYKNPDDIPEEVYTRVGKKKPRKRGTKNNG